jgi:hypothetical protein
MQKLLIKNKTPAKTKMGYIRKTKVLCTAKIIEISPTKFDKIDFKILRYNCGTKNSMLKSPKEFLNSWGLKESNPTFYILKLKTIEKMESLN